MLRATLALALLVALAPSAKAADVALEIFAPETVDATAGPVVATVLVGLRVQDFACSEDHAFVVTLASPTEGEVSAHIEPQVVFTVPAGSYLIDPWEGRAAVNATISARSPGDVLVFARFQADDGSCVTAGGFPAAEVGTRIGVHRNSSEPAPVNDTGAPPAEVTEVPEDANATGADVADAANATDDPSATNGTPASAGPTTCAPSATCGYIGEFDPGAAPEESRDAPMGAVALVAVLVGALLLARKR